MFDVLLSFIFQLKHCGKQVYDLLLSLVKSLDISPAKHLLDLMSQLEPAAHTEQVHHFCILKISYLQVIKLISRIIVYDLRSKFKVFCLVGVCHRFAV